MRIGLTAIYRVSRVCVCVCGWGWGVAKGWKCSATLHVTQPYLCSSCGPVHRFLIPARHSQATQRGVTEAEETAQSRQADVKQMQADVKRHRWVW